MNCLHVVVAINTIKTKDEYKKLTKANNAIAARTKV